MTQRVPVPDDVIQHLHMIQAVIGRLSNASFRTTQMALVVAAALLALLAQIDWVTAPGFGPARLFAVMLPFLVTAGFLCLDARFVYLEFCYREKYDQVRRKSHTDFDMSYDNLPGHWLKCKFCTSHVWEYGGICLLLLLGGAALNQPFGG